MAKVAIMLSDVVADMEHGTKDAYASHTSSDEVSAKDADTGRWVSVVTLAARAAHDRSHFAGELI